MFILAGSFHYNNKIIFLKNLLEMNLIYVIEIVFKSGLEFSLFAFTKPSFIPSIPFTLSI